MMRFVCTVIMLMTLGVTVSVRAEAPSTQDQYLQIYLLIQETDKLEISGQKATARDRYQIALDRLKKLQADNQDWEPTIVNYRINYCQEKINTLQDARDANPNVVTPPPVSSDTTAQTPSPSTTWQASSTTAPAAAAPVSQTATAAATEDPAALKKQITELQDKLADTASQLTQAKTDTAALRAKVADLETALKTARAGSADEKTAALLAENKKLNDQLVTAQATIVNLQGGAGAGSLATLQEQLKKVQDQLALARQENEALRQTNDDYKTKLTEAQKHLDTANAQLAVAPDHSAAQKENLVLRDIIQREMAEQARREIAKRIALEELQNLAVSSDKLKSQIDLLGSPLIQLTDEETAMLKGSATQLAGEAVGADSGNFAAKKNDTGAVDYSTQARVPAEFKDTAKAANDFFIQQKFDEAAAQYQNILNKYPQSLYALSNLGVVRFQQQKYDEAEQYLRQATGQASDDAFAHSMLGITLYQAGKYDEAVQVLTRAVALAPNDPKTHNYLGISASQKGWQEAAEQECRKAIELDPQYGDAHFNLAVIYATQRPPSRELAKRHYERALELSIPRDPQLEKMIYVKDLSEPQKS
ncbi:MAG: tetratricopeptide repeat protein [Verrucomicrobiales bacterium]|jgi:Flp pilus assembly protein TadD|nr:tetratricopeptide repeat protein [Verrucomicrobiales bacterium]